MLLETNCLAGATSNASMHRITSNVPNSAFFLKSPFSHGKPHGNSLDRTGLGSKRFADTAPDQVEHGGDMMMMSNSPVSDLGNELLPPIFV